VDPTVRVGLVTAVMAEGRLAEVREVDTREFWINDAVTFIDTEQKPLTNGRVVYITPEAVHVRYENPRTGGPGREPREGDLAVRFKLTH
jgi:hypothetical protein